MPPPRPRAAPTYPALKYGPTKVYGVCETQSCSSEARATCPDCDGHFCRAHVDHRTHSTAVEPGTDD